MKNLCLNLTRALLLASLFLSQAIAQHVDKTLSPYFLLDYKENVTQMPLRSTKAEVKISATIADVSIFQEYQNTGSVAIEAVYVFPGSSNAAVYDMEMRIGKKLIKAKVKEKEVARKEYQEAKAAGKRASLLEQKRPNVFSMNVVNIRPGETVEVKLCYTEPLIPEDGIYEFVYPTVVAPRFSGEEEAGTARAAQVAHTVEGEKSTYTFDIKVNVNAGLPLQDISCSTHKTRITSFGLNKAELRLDPSENKGGDRDFVMEYQLAGKKIASGLLLYEGKDENHFMWTIQPPKKITSKDIPQREYVFVVDVSGSMNGFPTEITKKLMRNLIGNLRAYDKFNILFFASSSQIFAEESVYANEEQLAKALKMLDFVTSGGGTRLYNAINKAVEIPACDEGLSRSIVVITDGLITVEQKVYDFIRKHNREFNFYAFGIGRSVNRFLIEGIANMGNSEPLIIMNKNAAASKAEKFRQYISSPVLTNININWGDFDVYDLEPSNHSDLLAERAIVVTGKYRGKPTGEIKLTGVSGENNYTAVYKASQAKPSIQNKALRYLWARKRIKLLDDYTKLTRNTDNVAEVTSLGLKYNLLTNYTSFIAVDHNSPIASNPKPPKKIKQVLPLPSGLNNYAIAASPPQVAMGIGADLKISNSTKVSAFSKYKIGITESEFTDPEKAFLQIEISKKIAQLAKVFGKEKIVGLELFIEIDDLGKIVQLELIDTHIPKERVKALLKQIEAWNFVLRKSKNTTFHLSIA